MKHSTHAFRSLSIPLNDCLNEISKVVPNARDEIDENATIGIQTQEIDLIFDSTLPGVKANKHVFESGENVSKNVLDGLFKVEFYVIDKSALCITHCRVKAAELFIRIEFLV